MSRRTGSAGLTLNFFLAISGATLNVLFGSFKLINLLNIRFYYLYSPQTINIVIFSPAVDWAIWVFSLLLVVFELLFVKIRQNVCFPRWTIWPFLILLGSLAVFLVNDTAAYLLIVPIGLFITSLSLYYGNGYLVVGREEAVELTLSCTAALLILFELASTSSWIFNVFDYEVPFGPGLRWWFPTFDFQLFNVLYPLTSWLLLLFLYSWIWIPALKYAFQRVAALKRLSSSFKRSTFLPVQDTISARKLNRRHLALGLILSSVTAVFIAYYPYINLSNSILVGSDSVEYYSWLKQFMLKGPLTAFGTDRPLPNLLMYSIQWTTGLPPETVVRIMPMILAVLLNLAVFWFVKQGTKDERMALTASVLSTFSFQTTVGLFAYFVANWLAIIESLLMLVFLMKSFEKQSWKYAAASALTGFAVLLTHPYTWDVLMAILVFYLAWTLFRRKPDRKLQIVSLFFLLASNLVFYIAYTLAPFGKGVSSGAGTASSVLSSISISNLLNLQNNLASMVQSFVGGLFGNPLLILLAVAGTLSMFNLTKTFNRIMLLWIIVPSLAILAVSPDPYYYRFIYLIPIQIQAAAGLHWTLDRLGHTRSSLETDRTLRTAPILIATLVLLLLLNFALRTLQQAPLHLL
jgi:hypothetical protein